MLNPQHSLIIIPEICLYPNIFVFPTKQSRKCQMKTKHQVGQPAQAGASLVIVIVTFIPSNGTSTSTSSQCTAHTTSLSFRVHITNKMIGYRMEYQNVEALCLQTQCGGFIFKCTNGFMPLKKQIVLKTLHIIWRFYENNFQTMYLDLKNALCF